MILERSVDRAAPATPKLRVKTKKKFSSIFRMLEPSVLSSICNRLMIYKKYSV